MSSRTKYQKKPLRGLVSNRLRFLTSWLRKHSPKIQSSVPYRSSGCGGCWRFNLQDLELVLYPGKEAGSFELQLCNLSPGASYKTQGAGNFFADEEGNARINIVVDGRTVVLIEPIKWTVSKRHCLKLMGSKIKGVVMLEISQCHINMHSWK